MPEQKGKNGPSNVYIGLQKTGGTFNPSKELLALSGLVIGMAREITGRVC